jgi:phenylpyruvate tautomerase PptA (4-oxalocrotonate tautomerase family)
VIRTIVVKAALACGLVLLVGAALRAAAVAQTPPLQQPKRIALIVGNSAYPGERDRLRRPGEDTKIIQRALKDRGFIGIDGQSEPSLRSNVKGPELRAMVARLRDALIAAGPGAIGFFYYAGHGVSDDVQNYIVAVDAPDVQSADAAHRIPIYDITDALHRPLNRGESTIVVVIDACRTGARAGGRSSPGAGPLLNQQDPGMLLALSAGIGEAASDSGEYAEALAKAINTPGLTIPVVFEQVKRMIWQTSQSAQMPVHASGPMKDVCLISCSGGREVLTDPREILAKRGILWTVDNFNDAIRRGDLETVKLFLAGKMATNSSDSQGRTLPVMLALNKGNADRVIDLLARNGVDLEARYEVWAPMGAHKKTLLEHAIEKGNMVVAKALLARKVRLDQPMETYGGMGMTVHTYPLAAAFYWDQFEIARAMLDAGADPRIGNYAAYKQAQETMRKKPGSAREVEALLPRVSPPGAERARMDAQPQQNVDQCVKKIVAIPTNRLLDEASRFSITSVLTLGPKECVLAKANVSLMMNDGVAYRPGFVAREAQICCEKTFGVRGR